MRSLVRSQTAKRLQKLKAELRRVSGKRAAEKADDAEAIHDLRVSIRRLSQTLKVFRSWFEVGPVKRVRRRLRKLMRQCAAVRNCDIAFEVLRTSGWREPELSVVLAKERRSTRRDLTRTLADWHMRDRVAAWREELRARGAAAGTKLRASAKESAEENARRLLSTMLEDLFRAGREAARSDASDGEMHRFRLRAKRLRYTLELFEPVYGAKTKQIMASLKSLQSKLGAISDCATTLEMVRSNRGAAAAVRRLAGEREAEFRGYWKRSFRARTRVRWQAVLRAADGKK